MLYIIHYFVKSWSCTLTNVISLQIWIFFQWAKWKQYFDCKFFSIASLQIPESLVLCLVDFNSTKNLDKVPNGRLSLSPQKIINARSPIYGRCDFKTPFKVYDLVGIYRYSSIKVCIVYWRLHTFVVVVLILKVLKCTLY